MVQFFSPNLKTLSSFFTCCNALLKLMFFRHFNFQMHTISCMNSDFICFLYSFAKCMTPLTIGRKLLSNNLIFKMFGRCGSCRHRRCNFFFFFCDHMWDLSLRQIDSSKKTSRIFSLSKY